MGLVEGKGNPRLKGKPAASIVEGKIVAALGPSSLSSVALAAVLDMKQSAIYRYCRKLEEAGVLASVLEPGARLLYCVDDEEVLTQDNYDRCHGQNHEIRSFAGKKRVWHLRKPPRR